MEIWKPVIGYEGIYEVSSLGQIKSLNYKRTGLEQILKPSKDKKGYLRTALTNNGKSKTIKVHRVVCEAFFKLDSDKFQVNHINGIKTDNRTSNLEWCTNSENQLHAIKIGLVIPKCGDEHPRMKYTNEFVLNLHKEYLSGLSKRELAKKYKLDRSIFRRKILSNVK